MKWIIVPILVALLLILVVSNIVIVQQSRAYVVERLGAFRTVWNVGPSEGAFYRARCQKGELEGAGGGLCPPTCDHQR